MCLFHTWDFIDSVERDYYDSTMAECGMREDCRGLIRLWTLDDSSFPISFNSFTYMLYSVLLRRVWLERERERKRSNHVWEIPFIFTKGKFLLLFSLSLPSLGRRFPVGRLFRPICIDIPLEKKKRRKKKNLHLDH